MNDQKNDDSQPTEWEKLVANVRESISQSPLQQQLQREGLVRGDVWPQTGPTTPEGTESALAAQSKSWESQLGELGLAVIDHEEFTPLSSVNKRRVVATSATVSYL